MKKFYSTLITAFLSLSLCNGQEFISKYPELTKKNLSEFFADWKAYSDSIAANVPLQDVTLDSIITCEINAYRNLSNHTRLPKFNVLLRYIKVDRYFIEADTTAYLKYGYIYDQNDNNAIIEYRLDSITPPLSPTGLYLTDSIESKLSHFAGGLNKADGTLTKIKNKNLKTLSKYIDLAYGHWGGYWHFCTFPQIYRITAAHNLLIFKRRTSWCTGDERWYKKSGNVFIRDPERKNGWIE
ncbi:hypothetical protein [Coprobacter tertius]|uniref:Uncharacterized protein n=1 Tax=Coprobacter tertius TaxID=2944915 RepID=A0ABT1MFI1_9BACT|nr:hypothetical protein [Coprobacter tertius]MCP9611390.1 hypothetical protein [Coprobacter tertius]